MKEQPNFASAQCRCVVRPPQPGDCDRMAALAGQLGYECTGKEVLERLGDMQESNQYVAYVAELPGGQIAGWIGAHVFRSVEMAACTEITGLVVDQKARFRGIGKLLITAAEEWARRVGCHAISVRSNVKRDRAHQF